MRKISDTLKSYVSLTEPIDYGYFVYIVMFYEGVGNLFPWNALINASGYFATRFCGTPYENNFENFFSIAYTLSQTIGLALSLKYQKSFSLRTKIVWPLVFISILFIITTLFVSIDIEGNLLFWLTLIFTFATGILGAVSSSGLFGLGAMFPPVYTGALMTGQGLAGLTVSISEILTLLAGPASDDCGDDNNDGADECSFSVDFSALAYFIIATFVLITCISAYLLICNLPFTM